MAEPTAPKPFNLLRWFSFVSIVVVATVGALSAYAVSKYFVVATLERDAQLSGQFIELIAEAEVRHANIGNEITMGELLDERRDDEREDMSKLALAWLRGEFFDHATHIPDALLVNVFAPDGVIVLSSNPSLVGERSPQNEQLGQVFQTKKMTGSVHIKPSSLRSEQRFMFDPDELYVENYIPMLDRNGNVAAVIEIYKEPKDLLRTLTRGYLMIWLVGLGSALVIWGALYWIVRHGADLLRAQQEKLVENETLVAIGELASAVAHGLRNPLASIRSSAELALDTDDPPIRKNLEDIIKQVDRLSKWVRQLLLHSRPITEEGTGVDLFGCVDEALHALEVQMQRAGVELDWQRPETSPLVVAHPALVLQALNSVLSNAVEAMPAGGKLSLSVAPAERPGRVVLTVADTGVGMSDAQLATAFKLYYSTKRNGLGVGLPLVKRIMERFGGTVGIESRVGAGTKVHLTFVLA